MLWEYVKLTYQEIASKNYKLYYISISAAPKGSAGHAKASERKIRQPFLLFLGGELLFIIQRVQFPTCHDVILF